jgi:hypothetical protein
MKRIGLWFLVTLAVAALVVAGCGSTPPETESEAAITVEEQGNGISLLTLSERAAGRLGVATAEVQDRGTQKVIPYAALIYDSQGATWAYAVSGPLVYQRAPITVETISGDEAILSAGPDAGTEVVIVGAAELYGAETGVGGGH